MRPGKAAISCLLAALLLWPAGVACATEGPRSPAMKDFIGICGHYHFDGPTFAPAARHVRNYHSLNWDLDVTKPYRDPPYPFALNRVNWERLYGGWQQAGFEVDACIMFGGLKPEEWVTPAESAYGYGKAFARFFGPSGKALVTAAELGNEPGKYSDEQYRTIARALARGLREGDPKLRIATASVTVGESGDYAKSIACYDGWLDLVDILNVHTYAIDGTWPNRVRTHPEDPEGSFLKVVRDVIAWRDEHAPAKDVWVTEFGWDAHRPEGASLWEGTPIHERPSVLSRLQQAQYLARGYLLFAALGVDRAYMFWYQDDGPEKGLHNADGLVSKGVKQPAFYALASLKRELGDYAFARVLAADPEGVYAYLLEADAQRACVAVWSPTRDGEERPWSLDPSASGLGGFRVSRCLELALDESGGKEPAVSAAEGALSITATGTPRLIFLERGRSH